MIFDLPLQPSVDTEDNGEKLNNPFAAPIPLERFRGIQKNGVLTPVNIKKNEGQNKYTIVIDDNIYTLPDPNIIYFGRTIDKNGEPIQLINKLPVSINRIDYSPEVLDVYALNGYDTETKKYYSNDLFVAKTNGGLILYNGEKVRGGIGARFVVDSYFEGKENRRTAPLVFWGEQENDLPQNYPLYIYFKEAGTGKEIYIKDFDLKYSFMNKDFFECHLFEEDIVCFVITKNKKKSVFFFSLVSEKVVGTDQDLILFDTQKYQGIKRTGDNFVLFQFSSSTSGINISQISQETIPEKVDDSCLVVCRNEFEFKYRKGNQIGRIVLEDGSLIQNQNCGIYGETELTAVVDQKTNKNCLVFTVSTINGEELVLGATSKTYKSILPGVLVPTIPPVLIGGFSGEESHFFGNGGVFYTTKGTVFKVVPVLLNPRKLGKCILTGNLGEYFNTLDNKVDFYKSIFSGGWEEEDPFGEAFDLTPLNVSLIHQGYLSNSIASVKQLLTNIESPQNIEIIPRYPHNTSIEFKYIFQQINIYFPKDKTNLSKLDYQYTIKTNPLGRNFLKEKDRLLVGTSYTEGIFELLIPSPIWAHLNRQNDLIGNNQDFGFLYALPPELTRSGKGDTGYLNYFVDSFFDNLEASFYISGNLYVYQNGTIKQVTLDPNGAIRTVQRLTNNLEYRFIGNSSTEAFFLDEMNSRVYAFRGYWELERIFDFSDFPENYKIKGKVLYSFYSNSKDIFFFLFEGASGNEMLMIKDRNIVNILNPGDLYQYKTGEDLIVYENNQKIFLISVDSDTNKEKVFDIDFDVNGDHLDGLELLTEWIGFPGESETRLNKLFLNFDIGSSNIGEIEVNLWYKRNPIDVEVQKVKFQPEKTGRTTLQISPRVQNFNRFKIEVKIPPLKDWRILGISADITQGSQRLIKEQNKR